MTVSCSLCIVHNLVSLAAHHFQNSYNVEHTRLSVLQYRTQRKERFDFEPRRRVRSYINYATVAQLLSFSNCVTVDILLS